MVVTNVLAVVPTADLAVARPWWAALLGEDAGSASVTLGVDDVDAELAAIAQRGLAVPEAQTVPSGRFRIAVLQDPDGNSVVLAQATGA